MRANTYNMKNEFVKFLEDMGIGWKFVINGFIGATVWSLFKKSKFLEALRQILIGSLVAGYLTPLIANREGIPQEFLASLSFIIGMLGMIIIEYPYLYLAGKLKQLKLGKKALNNEENIDNNLEK